MFHLLHRQIVFSLLGAVALLLLSMPRVFGQAFVNGSIAGTVSDSSGAVVPAVRLTLTSLETGARLATQSGSNGLYQFLNLPPGQYRLVAEKSGFRQLTRESITIEINNSLKIDIALPLGTISESVVVTAENPALQPDTSSLGQVIEKRAVNELPLNGRNPMALVALVPGVVPQGGFGTSMVGQNPFASGNVQINGGQANQSISYWDGAPLNAVGYANLQALIPTQDALQEFKVMTDNLPAQYDRFAGGIISFTTKTGSNRFHGEMYEYIRNKVLNANNYFNNQAVPVVPTPPFTQNQFGGNFGGPVVIPRLYNGKDKTFFFFSYDGFRIRQGIPLLFNVPTAAERTGDFSNLRDQNGNVIPIYDPATTDPTTLQRTQINCNGVLNVICPGSIDPTARVLENLWALPNRPGNQFTNFGNWVGNASSGGSTNQYTVRVDQNVSDKQRVFVRYTRSYWDNLAVDPFHTNTYPLSTGVPEKYTIQQTVLSDSYAFSPSVIADVSFSYLREKYLRTPATLGMDLTQLGGTWGSLNSQFPIRSLPAICLQNFVTSFCSQETGAVIQDFSDDYTIRPNLSVVRGRHTLKFGADVWISKFNYVQTNIPTGVYNFTDNFTSDNPTTGNGGFAFASFLLGDVSGGGAVQANKTAAQIIYRAFYAQDDIRVTRKLTLNLGLRYNQEGPFSERFNRQSTFLTNADSPLAALTGLPLKGALALVATPQWRSRNPYDMSKNQWAPRFGFGYEVNSKTALRGGYGVFYLPTLSAGSEAPAGDPIDSFFAPVVGSVNNAGVVPLNRLSNPYPNGVLQPPGRSPNFEFLLRGAGLGTTIPTTPFPGYVQQWNLDLQRVMPGKVSVDLAYAGSRGVHLPGYGNIDQLDPKYLSLGNSLLDSVPNPFFDLVPSFSPLAGSTVSRGQLLLPYPQFSGLFPTTAKADSSYHSMQLKVAKRFGDGQQILAAYTASKNITNADTLTNWLEAGGSTAIQNNYDLKSEEALATFDVSQRLVVSYVLELPFGHGKKYLGGGNGLLSKAVSGWGVQGISTFQKGFPLFLSARNLNQGFGGSGERPNFDSAACPHGAGLRGPAESRLPQWFNTACFVQPAAFTFGNVSRTLGNVRADGLANWDFAIFKNTTFGPEARMGLEFKSEFFNLFNTPQFGYPDQGCCTASNPDFGRISSQANLPRLIQFGMKFSF